jgi:hypothetical protein
MVEGLKLTFSGNELRNLFEQGARRHEEKATRWRFEAGRTEEEETEEAPLLPQSVREYEVERHVWRARVLSFLRDHVDANETYRLGAADLAFGELLPGKPACVEQDEYEERTRLGFNLERLAKSVDGLTHFRATRLDVENGPEIIKVEQY